MVEARRIAVLTTGRQDYGILRSTLRLLRDEPSFELLLWAGGMHLSAAHGRTVELVRQDGFHVDAELDNLGAGEPPAPEVQSARMLERVATELTRSRPDALVLLGDRQETLAAGFAATLCTTPIVHLHGGEESEGAIDNALRHALTKLSHLHLVSHELHARRVVQMGEDPATVVVVGAAGLDNMYRDDLPDRASLEAALGLTLEPPVVLVTQHPTTLGDGSADEVRALAEAMEQLEATYVITQPNADAGGAAIRQHWLGWAPGRSRVAVVDALGEKRYWGLLRIADAMVGNSSSGILEAPAAGLPVVNVGDRQRGRLRSAHVRDAPAEPRAIAEALGWALAPETHASLRGTPGPYPAGAAAPRIVAALAGWAIPCPPRKRFRDLPEAPA